jgi:DeoR/GlpR family transcriptional regulator of sugar metabolism
VNRTDRLYALVEELRAVAPRPRSARWLAEKFAVTSRTIERDLSALQQRVRRLAGVERSLGSHGRQRRHPGGVGTAKWVAAYSIEIRSNGPDVARRVWARLDIEGVRDEQKVRRIHPGETLRFEISGQQVVGLARSAGTRKRRPVQPVIGVLLRRVAHLAQPIWAAIFDAH